MRGEPCPRFRGDTTEAQGSETAPQTARRPHGPTAVSLALFRCPLGAGDRAWTQWRGCRGRRTEGGNPCLGFLAGKLDVS